MLRNFYVGITSWNRFVLDTTINGNFIEAPVWEALNVIENLVGNLPVVSIQEDITLAHIIKKHEKIELEIVTPQKSGYRFLCCYSFRLFLPGKFPLDTG